MLALVFCSVAKRGADNFEEFNLMNPRWVNLKKSKVRQLVAYNGENVCSPIYVVFMLWYCCCLLAVPTSKIFIKHRILHWHIQGSTSQPKACTRGNRSPIITYAAAEWMDPCPLHLLISTNTEKGLCLHSLTSDRIPHLHVLNTAKVTLPDPQTAALIQLTISSPA